jgi:guanylate kinase
LNILKKNLLIVISGPSGVGKGTILQYVKKLNKNIQISISATTRTPRSNERNGVDYYFMSKQQFLSNIKDRNMLEYAYYNQNYYGTLRSVIDDFKNKGFDIILEIDVQGALQIKKKILDAILIFILPPNICELKKRLHNRNTENIQERNHRIKLAQKEMYSINEYHYTIVNQSALQAAQQILKIIINEKYKNQIY